MHIVVCSIEPVVPSPAVGDDISANAYKLTNYVFNRVSISVVDDNQKAPPFGCSLGAS
jgi:hypothetical protein